MKFLSVFLLLTCLSVVSIAQNIYQIRADSVRIYNVCDTAELILENRTKDTSGFLFNKGNGRTEFRRLHLKTVGTNSLAIPGQDTIDMSIWGDGRYDLKSTNFWTLTDTVFPVFSQWPLNKVVGYEQYVGSTADRPVLSNQSFFLPSYPNFYKGIVVRDARSAFEMTVNWNGELFGPNGVFFRIKDDTQSKWSNWREVLFKDYGDKSYVQNQIAVAQPGNIYLNGTIRSGAVQAGVFKTTAGTSLTGVSHFFMYNGEGIPKNLRWSQGMIGTESGAEAGSEYRLFRYSDTGAFLGSALAVERASGIVTAPSGIKTNNLAINTPFASSWKFTVTDTSSVPYTPLSTTLPGPVGMLGTFFNMTGMFNSYAGIGFQNLGPTGLYQAVFLGSVAASDGSGYTANLVFGQRTALNAYAERMRISTAGFVGIGTSTPAAMLDVAGTVRMGSLKNNALLDSVLMTDTNGNLRMKKLTPGVMPVNTVTTNVTLGENDCTVIINNTAAVTVTLPAAAANKGRMYYVKKVSNNTLAVTIQTQSGDLLDSGTSTAITTWNKCVHVQSNGLAWYILN
ncbi:hypothetical protein PV783_33170 [Chitinophaga sp. CC14]|uniref:hypothetical protein n=1 Tax=Chitinophaga sp. CC14 TaxID=3029199 RepID=UPI003B7B626F